MDGPKKGLMMSKLIEPVKFDKQRGMGANYVGLYANTFQASSIDGTYRNISKLRNKGF